MVCKFRTDNELKLSICICIRPINLFSHYHNFDCATLNSPYTHRMLRSKAKSEIVCLFLFEIAGNLVFTCNIQTRK